jgi:hypothetical protein
MFHKIRLLGLALLTVIAVGAVPVASAQAGTFTAGAYPATLTGAPVGTHEFTTAVGTMECAPAFHGVQAAAAGQITVVPLYGESCSIAGLPVHVNRNGCDFRLYAGNTLGMDEVAGSMEINCPEGNRLDFEITGVMQVCHLTVPPQGVLGPITYTNRTFFDDVDIDFNVVSVGYILDMGCPEVGPFPNGTYVGTSTLKTDNEGMPTPNKVD